MKKFFVILLFAAAAGVLVSCVSSIPATSETVEIKEFKRATLAMANQVADLFDYDRNYYSTDVGLGVAKMLETDPDEKEKLQKKYDEFLRANPDINNLQHALDTGITVCGGYSKLFYKLAEEAGYDVYYILTITHAYNAILFEGTWYFFDITGYDTSSNRNVRWLWSTGIWNDWMHTSHVDLYKLDNTYEIDSNATRIAAEALGTLAFSRSEGGFKVLIKDGRTVTITGYTGSDTDVVIPATIGGKPVVEIQHSAFNWRKDITSISIPASAALSVFDQMDEYFEGCTGLTTIQVDANNKFYSSRDGVLFNKKGDELIKYPAGKEERQYAIPAGVTWIKFKAFRDCTDLTSVSIPASVTNGGLDISMDFDDCPNLTAILIDTSDNHYSSRDGVLFNKRGNTLIQYPAGKKGQYAIPEGVTDIGDFAFANCTGLTSVSIPASVKSIGDFAFVDCTGLTEVSIPAGVKRIGEDVFLRCTGLTQVSIPAGVKSIGYGAFHDCTSLTDVSIPASVTRIEAYAFYGYNITTVRIGAKVKIGDWRMSFKNDFHVYYSTNGKKAGVYTWSGSVWSYSAR